MRLLRFTLTRLAGMIIVLLVVAVATFAIFYLMPADPARLSCGRPCTDENLVRIAAYLGTDQPWFVQLGEFLKGIVVGRTFGDGAIVCDAPCFGYSFQRNAPALELIASRLPVSASIAIGAAIIWLVTGIAAGALSALRRGTPLDRGAMTLAIAGVSTPMYVVGMLLILFVGFGLRWFPTGGYVPFEVDPWQWLRHLVLPWLTVAIVTGAIYARLARGEMLEVMGQDYIRTARAKGLSEARIIRRHGLRTAVLPIVTVFGLDLATLIGGTTVIAEQVFAIQGIGSLLIDSVGFLDLQLVVGLTLFAAFLIVLANFVVDVVYGLVDPRVRVS